MAMITWDPRGLAMNPRVLAIMIYAATRIAGYMPCMCLLLARHKIVQPRNDFPIIALLIYEQWTMGLLSSEAGESAAVSLLAES